MPTTPGAHHSARHGVRGQARREEIVRAAIEVVAERGFLGASLAAVADRVGITQQGLLHYFPTKDELLIAVLKHRDEWDTGGSVGTETAVDRSWTVSNLELLVEVNAARPEIVRTFSALLGESVTEDHPAGEYFRERYRWARKGAEAVLRREWGERLPSGLTPAEAAPLVLAVMDGLQFQWLHDPDGVDMAETFRAFVRLLGPAGADR
jgi:AcrR family transcriptional regulator